MNRFQSSFTRLYATQPTASQWPPVLLQEGYTRVLVIQAQGAQAWPALAEIWHGVQAQLQWPAPMIAVSGTDAFQLWLSLATPTPSAHVAACGQQLIQRFAEHHKDTPISIQPNHTLSTHLTTLPLDAPIAGQWAAFITRDLAPVFADTPWLDIAPNPEGQADLLAHAKSISTEQFSQLLIASEESPISTAAAPAQPPQTEDEDPRVFLRQVMNDPKVEIRWRIEAAKALLSGR